MMHEILNMIESYYSKSRVDRILACQDILRIFILNAEPDINIPHKCQILSWMIGKIY